MKTTDTHKDKQQPEKKHDPLSEHNNIIKKQFVSLFNPINSCHGSQTLTYTSIE